jgi:hypothetical protein
MKVYKNCPNCGGTLDNTGRCKYCDSKVYDFCDIDLNNNKKTYLRVKHQNQTIIAQVVSSEISITNEIGSFPVIEAEFLVLKMNAESEDNK